MSASIWYKKRLLYDGSTSILSGLSNKIMSSLSWGGSVNDDILAVVACLIHPSTQSLDNLSREDLRVLTRLLIKAVNELENEGYFVISAREREYLIKNNLPLDVRSDKRQALELIKGLEEIIKELESRE